ncbi:unnamed protein product, partial [marine sediment metagenome]
QRAIKKMQKKNCDMMIYNTVDSSLDKEMAKISILYPGEAPQKMHLMSKRECARVILLNIAKKMSLYDG